MSELNQTPQSKIEVWTPAKAKKQLELNQDNRPLSEFWVSQLAQAMEAGEYKLNGETIKIAINGMLKDGQHRLHAVILSGVTVKMLTVRGLPEDIFDTVDQGKKRSLGDILARHGEKSANDLASAIVWVWRHESGKMGQNATYPRAIQARECLDRNPKLRDSVLHGRSCRFLLRGGIGISAHYLFAKKNRTLADDFFARLSDGEGLLKGSGIYQLREQLIKNRSDIRKLRPVDTYARVIKAWIAVLNGTPIKYLKWAKDEEFPKIP